MTFSSSIFLFLFLPITLGIYYLLDERHRNTWLVISSMLFFGFSQCQYVLLLLSCVLLNYLGGLWINKSKQKKPIWLLLIFLNLFPLLYYKYSDFFISNFNSAVNKSIPLLNLMLPIGISFFTFMGISYITDIYHGKNRAETNFRDYALYISFFAHLTSGPIIRYEDNFKEIKQRTFDFDVFVSGIERFIIGLSKKVIIANTLARIVDSIWQLGAGKIPIETAWLGSIAYTLEIYYDFSGYSDMAIGIGKMFGFNFKENFNLPYISQSVSEFWRRWHISLSDWFKDYLYIPLGGNRHHQYLNLAIVYLITGLWHGASWNFIIWGIINGAFVILEHYFQRHRFLPFSFPSWLKHLYTMLVVNFGWVLFRADTLQNGARFIRNMLWKSGSAKEFTLGFYINRWTGLILILAILFSTSFPKRTNQFLKRKLSSKSYTVLNYIALIFLFINSVFWIIGGTYKSFIYFQF